MAAKNENKTTANDQSVDNFLSSVEDEGKRADSFEIIELMKEVTSLEPKMWGTSIVGFGNKHYKYESGREGDMPVIGFSPRKQNLTIYSLRLEEQEALLSKLGKFTTGKGCLYIKRLKDVDLATLKTMMEDAFKHGSDH